MLELLRIATTKRQEEWSKGQKLPLSFRGNELAGETGEVCNELKKLERFRLGMVGGKEDIQGLKEEIADVLICLDLVAMEFDISLEEVVRDKFNKTSEKYGLKTKL